MPHTSAMNLLLIGFLISLGLTAAASGAVFSPDTGHYYELVNAPYITWPEAGMATYESTLGGYMCWGYLATVTSQEENDFIVSTFGASALYHKWLGGFQDETDSGTVNVGWQWVTWEPWDYTNWNSGEPSNNYYAAYGYEDALTFWNNGKWNDAPHNWQYYDGGYVVEYDCRQIQIDLKPGSDPNCINIKNLDNGVIPLAILTTDDFDASSVDPSTIASGGLGARSKGKSGTIGSLEDVDGDGDLDLVVQLSYEPQIERIAPQGFRITAMTFEGAPLRGTDSICVVPDPHRIPV
jgi:hypothetical protein